MKQPAIPVRKAFTLLEVCLAIAIFIILLSLTAGVSGSFRKESALRGSANQIGKFVHDNRRTALSERRPVRMAVEAGGISVLTQNNDEASDDPPRPSPNAAVAFEDGVSLTMWNAGKRKWAAPKDAEWTIGLDGTMSASPFRLTHGKSYMDFEINPLTGEILETGFEL